jgi:RNA 2',3'-cyclic 3'-phosphodiesterase
MENEQGSERPRRPERRIRLFLGAQVSMATLESVAATAEAMRRAAYEGGYQIRWVAPANYHITLKFLGDASPEIVTAIRDRLAPCLASLPCVELTARGVGAFPDPGNARVIWAGVDDPSGGLTRIAELLESELAELGFRREQRAFPPHITMGRVKRVDDVSMILRTFTEQKFRSFRVQSIVLFESVMKSTGSEYIERARFGLDVALEGKERQTEPLQGSHHHEPDRDVEDAPGALEPAAMESMEQALTAPEGAEEIDEREA